MAPREAYVHWDVISSIPRRSPKRRQVIEFIKNLGEVSHLGGDYQEYDEVEQRLCEVSIIGGLELTWWIDDPVNQVKIIQSRPADGPR